MRRISCIGARQGALDPPPFPDGEDIRARLEEEGISPETITADERIAAWRTAVQLSGLKAAKVRGSAEQLVRRFLRGDAIGGGPGVSSQESVASSPPSSDLPPLVRLYCAVSARFVAPLGGYDVARLPSPHIALRFARSDDLFEPLGGNAADMPLTSSVPVYAVGSTVLCWMFNVRDAASTALTETTTEALFFSEALTDAQIRASERALNTLRETLQPAGARSGEITWSDSEGRLVVFPPAG